MSRGDGGWSSTTHTRSIIRRRTAITWQHTAFSPRRMEREHGESLLAWAHLPRGMVKRLPVGERRVRLMGLAAVSSAGAGSFSSYQKT